MTNGTSFNKKDEKYGMMNFVKDESDTVKYINEYNVETDLLDIIRKSFIEGDHNIELELKKFNDDKNLIEFFFLKFHLCTEEKLSKIMQMYKDSKLIDIISKTLIEIVPFLKLKFNQELLASSTKCLKRTISAMTYFMKQLNQFANL